MTFEPHELRVLALIMHTVKTIVDKFEIAFASDTDHYRHGIVTQGSGLLPPNHYLSVCVHYLFSNRKNWHQNVAVGKTVVSSGMIDRVSARLQRPLYEVPVGFKWFVEGLVAQSCIPMVHDAD